MYALAPTLLVLGGYGATLVGLGVAFARSGVSTDSVFRGDNAVPWWMAGLSQFMASHSAYLFVIVSGMIYTHGSFGLLWFALLYPVILSAGTWFFARRWHRSGVGTPVEYLERRYGPGVRQAYAWFGLLVRPLNNGVRMAAFGVIMAAMFGLDPKAPIWLGFPAAIWISVAGMGLVVTYTLLGGLMGAVVADAVQFVIFETALVTLFGISWHRLADARLPQGALPVDFLRLPGPGSPLWWWLGGWVILQFADTGAAQWGLITRFLCTRSAAEARKVGYLCALLYLPLMVLCTLPIVAARTLLPGINPEAAFGAIAKLLLPPGLLALMIAALFSATLATLSAELNTLSGVFTLDLYKRRWRPHAAESTLVGVGRWATAVLGATIALVSMVVLGGAPTVLRATQEISSLVVVPLAVPLLGGLFSSRPAQAGVILAFVGGVLTSFSVRLAGTHFGWSDSAMVLAQNGGAAVVSLAAFQWGGALFPTGARQRASAVAFLAQVSGSAEEPVAPPGRYPAPVPLIGAGVLAMALVQGGTLWFPGAFDGWNLGAALFLALLGLALVLAPRTAPAPTPLS
jgi:Na+/proline symporter